MECVCICDKILDNRISFVLLLDNVVLCSCKVVVTLCHSVSQRGAWVSFGHPTLNFDPVFKLQASVDTLLSPG